MIVRRPSDFIAPCLPSKVAQPPSRPALDGERVRCFTRGGHDWADRFPAIVDAALRIDAASFLIDGEAVVVSDDGRPDFHALRTRRNGHAVVLYAFDLIEHDGEDQIANALGGTERTIKAHRHRLMECQSKLDGACFSC